MHCARSKQINFLSNSVRNFATLEQPDFLRDLSGVSDDEIQERWVMDEAKLLSSRYYQNIHSVDGSLALGDIQTKDELHKRLKRQLQQELRTFDATVKIYRDLVSNLTDLGLAAQMKPEQRMLVHWYIPFSQAIEAEHVAIRKREPQRDRRSYGKYLTLMEPSKLAVITMYHCLNTLLAENRTSFTNLAVAIGRSVNTEHNLMKLQRAFSQKTLRNVIGVKADPHMVNRLASRMVGR